jgi:hypothetical protein
MHSQSIAFSFEYAEVYFVVLFMPVSMTRRKGRRKLALLRTSTCFQHKFQLLENLIILNGSIKF